MMRPLRHLIITEHNLGDTGAVAQINKDNATMVTSAGNPAGQRDGFTCGFRTQIAR